MQHISLLVLIINIVGLVLGFLGAAFLYYYTIEPDTVVHIFNLSEQSDLYSKRDKKKRKQKTGFLLIVFAFLLQLFGVILGGLFN